MKNKTTTLFLCLLSILLCSISQLGQAQHNHTHTIKSVDVPLDKIKKECKFFSGDTLNGFPLEATIEAGIKRYDIYFELKWYVNSKQISFVKSKYNIKQLPQEIIPAKKPHSIPSVLNASCNNIDFENGTFGGWVGTTGYNANSNTALTVSAPGFITSGVDSPEPSCSFHTLMTAAGGTDPFGGFPALDPGGGAYSVRLGGEDINTNSQAGTAGCTVYYPSGIPAYYSNGETMEQTFLVTPNNTLLTYNYAVVLAKAPHPNGQQPYFRVEVLDSSHAEIPCLNYYVQGDSAGTYPTGFVDVGGVEVLPWQQSSLNLLPYLGTNVTVRFTAAGCIPGGHFGYGYVDCACAPLEIIIPTFACTGGIDSLIAPPVAGSTYAWTGPGIVSGATSQIITANTGGTYEVTITNALGCHYTLDTTIVFHPTPTVTVNNVTICPGVTTTLTANSTGSAGALTYTWNPMAGLAFSPGDSVATLAPNTNATYSVTGKSAFGCTNTAVANITMNPVPTATITVPAVCEGTGSAITAAVTNGNTYSWNFGGAGVGTNITTATPTYIYSTAGTFPLSLLITSANSCTATATGSAVVNPLPTATISTLPVCQGAPTIFTSTITSGNTYMWDYGDPTGTPVAGSATPTHTYGAPGNFPVSLTVTAVGACTVTATTNAVVNPVPTATISVNPVCLGTVSSFSSTVTNGNTYVWNFGGAGTGSNITTATPAYIYSAANTFPVSLTVNSAASCSVIATTNAVVKPIPVVDPILPAFYCSNQTTNLVHFTCQPTGGTPTFNYTTPNGIGISQTGDLLPFVITNTTTVSETATFTVNATLNGCLGPNSTFNITVYPNPIAHFFYTKICEGQGQMAFTDESVAYGGLTLNSWQWDMNNDGTVDVTGQNPHYPMPVGSSMVNLQVGTSSLPSCTAQVTEPVYVNPKPIADFTGVHLQGCPTLQGTMFTDHSTPLGQILSWNWQFGNGQSYPSQSPPSQSYSNTSPIDPQFYSVNLTVTSDSGCVGVKTRTDYVEVYPRPIANFSWGPGDADIDQPIINFVNGATGANPYPPALTYGQYGVEYYLGDTYNSSSNYVHNNTSFSHTYSDPDLNDVVETYSVTQRVINSYGCTDSIIRPVNIQPIFTFYIPNAFSPNGDRKNEGFKGLGMGIDNTTYNLWVFDRWGLMIYHATDIDKAWDGHMLGREDKPVLQEDVYVWKVKFNDIFGQIHEYHGTVTLVK
ncbi:MAG TPA: PKD domain-containing protein [Bacteroidia bacterium]|nr:PKD domain-containing protein [Bacteroidia bacterium]